MKKLIPAAIATTLMLMLSATSASAATGTSTPSDNLSPNPIFASSTAGWSTQEGGSAPTRVAVSDHASASFAGEVTSSKTTTRIRAPRVPVTAGKGYTFSIDAKAAKAGAQGQLTVSWYSSSAFLSFSSGTFAPLSPTNWTQRGLQAVVPANATQAEAVMNVTGTASKNKVTVTQHIALAPAASPSPTPTATTASPTPSETATSSTPTPSETATSSTPTPSETATTTAPTTTTTAPTTITNLPGQPAITAYGSSSYATPFAHEGALIIAGRDQYNQQPFKDASAAGATVLLYVDAIIDNPYGRYHDMLVNASECGPATARWPGSPQANQWGYLQDFRNGSIVQQKLPCVLEKALAENPHLAGFFADDLGSRSWFPNFNWGSINQQEYRDGAIGVAKIFHDVAVRHGLMVMVNGTWTAGSLSSSGGGYPDMNKHGLSFADGGYVEHHSKSEVSYWSAYAQPGQWGTAPGSVSQGKPFMYVQASTDADRDAYKAAGVFAYLSTQQDYESATTVWGPFHPTGLPSKVAQ